MDHISKRLVLAGRMKPEVRLGVAISEFAKTLDDKQRQQFHRMQTSNKHLTGLDVVRATEEMNKDLVDGSSRRRAWITYGTKAGSFLSRVQKFASVGDVLIGGTQNMIATGVWSAIRLCLMSAATYIGYSENLSTLFLTLNNSWKLHENFTQLFAQSKDLQMHLCEYLVLTLKLCSKAITFSRKSLAFQVLSSVGSSFESEFGLIREEMMQRGRLIEQTTQHLAAKSQLESDSKTTERISEISRLMNREADMRSAALKYQILQQLSPGQSQYEATWRRQRRKGTCRWISECPAFKMWLSSQRSSVLCVTGKLGSGKTVAMSNIVAHVATEQPCKCAYFFCIFKEPESLKAVNIVRSLVYHFLDDLTAADRIWHTIVEKCGSDLLGVSSPYEIVDVVLEFLPRDQQYIVILDGLEDCPDDDIEDTFEVLQRLMQQRTVLLCHSARSDSRYHLLALERLGTQVSLSLDTEEHDEEIAAFVMEEMAKRNATRYLSPELEDRVMRQLVAGAQGMYLWVSLQIDSIFPGSARLVVTEERTRDLINNLPKSLPDAFERALEGIIDKSYKGKILKLVMAAESPLSIDEIRVALALKLGDATAWYAERVPSDGAQLISLCGGSLLDVDEEDGKVRLIHHSVKTHVLSQATSTKTVPYHFSLEEAHNFVGSVCVTYLNLPIFESRLLVSRKLQAEKLVDKVKASINQDNSMISFLAQHVKPRKRASWKAYQFDLGRLALEGQTSRLADDFDPRCFKAYALDSWLIHTRFFKKHDSSIGSCWNLWLRLLSGHVEEVKPPFEAATEGDPTALLWARSTLHFGLLRVVLHKRLPTRRDQILYLMEQFSKRDSIYDEWLECIMAVLYDQPHSKGSHHDTQGKDLGQHQLLRGRVRFLAALGADYMARLDSKSLRLEYLNPETYNLHVKHGPALLELSIALLSEYASFPAEDDPRHDEAVKVYNQTLYQLLAHPDARKSMGEAWLLESLKDMSAVGNLPEIRAVCAHHPSIRAAYSKGFPADLNEFQENLPNIEHLLRVRRTKLKPIKLRSENPYFM